MNINDLLKEFQSKSKKTHSEIVDSKHIEIIKNSKENFKNLKQSNFRNWADQNDMGLKYPMTYFSKVFLDLKKNIILEWIYQIPKKRLKHYFEFSTMLDDISIIKSLDGEKLLNENPQSKTPGATNFPLVNGYSVSSRWLRYLYILNRIIKLNLIEENDVWLDVGSYYGGLQGLVKKYFPDIKIIMVDFNHQLTRSYIYLKQMYPNANHIFPIEIDNYSSIKDIPKGSILYIEVNDFEKLEKFKVNLVTNFFSLGEMKKQTFKKYIQSKIFQNADIFYSANRFISSPFFEKTYDDSINIFDYKFKNNFFYFDIFPISHYQVTPRNILKRNFFRNISSQYFEIIFKNK